MQHYYDSGVLLKLYTTEAESDRMVAFDWPEAWIRCQTIARTEAGRIGVRTPDIRHVACALTLHATQFVTNDQRQAKLAKKCGLSVINPCV